jgi:hypothetical protein
MIILPDSLIAESRQIWRILRDPQVSVKAQKNKESDRIEQAITKIIKKNANCVKDCNRVDDDEAACCLCNKRRYPKKGTARRHTQKRLHCSGSSPKDP